MTLLDLPRELLERILFHVADPGGIRAAGRSCKRLAAVTAAASPLWRALLASRVDLSRRPGRATGWETEFYCYWDDSYGDPTDEVAFAPPLGRVRGWTGGAEDGTTAGGVGGEGVSGSGSGGGGGGSAGGDGTPAAPPDAAADADDGSAGDGGWGAQTTGGFLYTDTRRAARSVPAAAPANGPGATAGGAATSDGDAAAPDGDVAAADDDAGGQSAAKRSKVAATAFVEDPRLLYTALVAATRAGDAVADPAYAAAMDRNVNLWSSEAQPLTHVWVVRVDPPGIPWPPVPAAAAEGAATAATVAAAPPASEAAMHAAATALLTAAGASPPVVAALGTTIPSGGAADAIYTRHIGEPIEAVLGERHSPTDPLSRHATASTVRRVAAGNDAVRALLGGRPALLFEFGEEAMNPVGAVLAVAWSPQLIAGLLVEVVRT